jgi:hypothetical protein
VLNLPRVKERFGDQEDYNAKPLFRTRLNSCLLIKHTLRPGEADVIVRPGLSCTKIVIPFSAGELELGGASIYVEERDFRKRLSALIGNEAKKNDIEEDIHLLEEVSRLPSFDPFLLRERLKSIGRDVAACYFDVSEADADRMLSFVAEEVGKLIAMAFEGQAAEIGLSKKMAELLLSDGSAAALEPLRLTMRMTPEEYRHGVYAWKGFLYYKWQSEMFGPKLKQLIAQIMQIRIRGATAFDNEQIDLLRRQLTPGMARSYQRVQRLLQDYDSAFESMTRDGDPLIFRQFLLDAPKLFLELGQLCSVFSHIDSFWCFRFPPGKPLVIDVDDFMTVLEEFCGCLQPI